MFVMMVASECAPVAKAGGLGDVVFGLSRELEIRGNSVEIVLPKYDCLRYDQILRADGRLRGPVGAVVWRRGALQGLFRVRARPQVLLHRAAFAPSGSSTAVSSTGSADDVSRFAFFSRAALEFMLKAGKHPEIIHCHDWQTGLVPVLLYEIYQQIGMSQQRVCYTVHNFGHQGVTGEWVLWATGLGDPARYFFPAGCRTTSTRSP